MIQQFFNRLPELAFLEERFRDAGPQLIVIYGRRRTGKTAIIREFLARHGGIYHLCTKDSVRDNVSRFSLTASRCLGKPFLGGLERWEAALAAALEGAPKRIPIAIDEFPYLIELDRAIPSLFQHLWDGSLSSDPRTFLLLCGSSVGMMETEVLGNRSPLYGRRTGAWKVTPFTMPDMRRLFPRLDTETFLKLWGVFGDIPAYFMQYDAGKGFMENVKTAILRKGAFLYDEPMLLLREEFREPRNLHLVLKNMAAGLSTPGKIQNAAGIDRGNISKYLEMLMETNIVGYERLMHKKRGGIYHIADNFLDFWWRNVYPHLSDLELHNVGDVASRIDIDAHMARMAERAVREVLRLKGWSTRRFILKGTEIDILAFDDKLRVCLTGEVKWQNKPAGPKVLADLEAKSELVKVPAGYMMKHLIFSKGGFTDAEAMRKGADLWDLKTLDSMIS
jgi:hypothetical protein